MPSWIDGSQHAEGLRVKEKYLRQYEGSSLELALPGTVFSSGQGDCYVIERTEDGKPIQLSRSSARDLLITNLRLLRGIGPEKEARLKAEGYPTIESLLGHPRWHPEARRALSLIDGGDARLIQGELWHWLPKGHLHNLHVAAFAGETPAIIDIETLGLFSRPIFLFGAAFVDDGRIRTLQFLARSIDEEPAALEAFCRTIGGKPLMSYNGRAFDVPYVNQRRWYYDLQGEIDNLHFDLLHFSRRAFPALPDARLTTVERHIFGEDREDDVPGALVPEFYEAYLETGNPGPLVPVVEHNRRDMVALARLFAHLCGEPHVADR